MLSRLKMLDLGLTVAAVAIALGGASIIGPKLETRLFPVYSKFKIYSIKALPDGESEVVFSYTKLRSCAPAGVTWFVGEPGAAFRQVDLVSLRPTNPPVNRPLGANISVPYVVDVAPEVLRDQGFASIYSNCHPFWITQSIIYP